MKTNAEAPTGDCLRSILKMRINPKEVHRYSRSPKTWLYHRTISLLGRRRKPGKFLTPLTILSRPVFQSGSWDLKAVPFEFSSAYTRIHDLYSHRYDYKLSRTYLQATESIARGVPFKHKKFTASSVQDVDRFFEEYLMDLVISMELHGYVDSKGLEPCWVLISREGEIIKGMKGRHRFAAAKITRATSIPVQISHIHTEFIRKQEIRTAGRMSQEKLAKVIRLIEERYQ